MAFENIGINTTKNNNADDLYSPVERGNVPEGESIVNNNPFANAGNVDINSFVSTNSPINEPTYKTSTTGKQTLDKDDKKQFSYGYGYLRNIASNELQARNLSHLGDPRDYAPYGVKLSSVGNPDVNRAARQRWWTQAGNATVQAVLGEIVGGTLAGLGSVVDISKAVYAEQTGSDFDWENDPTALSKLGYNIMDYARELAPIQTREAQGGSWDIGDSGWWFNGVTSAASTVGLLIPGTATAGAANKFGQVSRLGTRTAAGLRSLGVSNPIGKAAKLGKYAQAGITGVTMRNAENFRESLDVAAEIKEATSSKLNAMSDEEFAQWKQDNPLLLEKYKSKYGEITDPDRNQLSDYAASAAGWRAYQVNGTNLVFDIAQSLPIFSVQQKIFSKFAPSSVKAAQRSAIKSLGKATVEEGRRTIPNILSDTFRYGSILGFENLSEGLEEAINFVGQEEGLSYGRRLLGEEQDKGFNSRLDNYIKDPELYESAFWGVVGGVLFGAARPAFSKVYDKAMGNTYYNESQERIDETVKWVQKVNDIKDKVNIIDNGKNPFIFTNSGYADINVSKGENLEDNKNALKQRLFEEVIDDMAIEAGKVGNGNLLRERFLAEDTKDFLINNNIVAADGYNQTVKNILKSIDKVEKSFDFYNSKIDGDNESINNILAAKAVRYDLQIDRINNDIRDLYSILDSEANKDKYPIFNNENIPSEIRHAIFQDTAKELQNIIPKLPETTLEEYLHKRSLIEYLDSINDYLESVKDAGYSYSMENINGLLLSNAISKDYYDALNAIIVNQAKVEQLKSYSREIATNSEKLSDKLERQIKRIADTSILQAKNNVKQLANEANTISELENNINKFATDQQYNKDKQFITEEETSNIFENRRKSILAKEKRFANKRTDLENTVERGLSDFEIRLDNINTKEELNRLKEDVKSDFNNNYSKLDDNLKDIPTSKYNELLDKIDKKIESLTPIETKQATNKNIEEQKQRQEKAKDKQIQTVQNFGEIKGKVRELLIYNPTKSISFQLLDSKIDGLEPYENGIYDISNPSLGKLGSKYLIAQDGMYTILDYNSFGIWGVSEPLTSSNLEAIKRKDLAIKVGDLYSNNLEDNVKQTYRDISGTEPYTKIEESKPESEKIDSSTGELESTQSTTSKETSESAIYIEEHKDITNEDGKELLNSLLNDVLIYIESSNIDKTLGERLPYSAILQLENYIKDDVKIVDAYIETFNIKPNKRGKTYISFLDFMNYVANNYGENIATNSLFYNRMLNVFKYININSNDIFTYENINDDNFVKAIGIEAILQPTKFLNEYAKSTTSNFNTDAINVELEIQSDKQTNRQYDRSNGSNSPVGSIEVSSKEAKQLEILSELQKGDKVSITISTDDFATGNNAKAFNNFTKLQKKISDAISKGKDVKELTSQLSEAAKEVNKIFTIDNDVPINITKNGIIIGTLPNIKAVKTENGNIDSNGYTTIVGLKNYYRPINENSYRNYADYLFSKLSENEIDPEINSFIEDIITIGYMQRNIKSASKEDKESLQKQINEIRNDINSSSTFNKILTDYSDNSKSNNEILNHLINVINYNGLYSKGYSTLLDSLKEWDAKLNRDVANAYTYKSYVLNEAKNRLSGETNEINFEIDVLDISEGSLATGRTQEGEYVYSNIEELFDDNYSIVQTEGDIFTDIYSGNVYKIQYQSNDNKSGESLIIKTKSGYLNVRTQRNTLGNTIKNTGNPKLLDNIKSKVIQNITEIISIANNESQVAENQKINEVLSGLGFLFDSAYRNEGTSKTRVGVNNEVIIRIPLSEYNNGSIRKSNKRLDIFFHNGSANGGNGYVNASVDGITYTTRPEAKNTSKTKKVSQDEIVKIISDNLNNARFNVFNDINKLSSRLNSLNTAFGFNIPVNPTDYVKWLVNNNILMTEATAVYNPNGERVSNFTATPDTNSNFRYNISLKLDTKSNLKIKESFVKINNDDIINTTNESDTVYNNVRKIASTGNISDFIDYLHNELNVEHRYDFIFNLVKPFVKLNSNIVNSNSFFSIDPISGEISITSRTIENIIRSKNYENEAAREDTIRKLAHEFIHKILYDAIDSNPDIAKSFYENVGFIKTRIREYLEEIENGKEPSRFNQQLGTYENIKDILGTGKMREYIYNDDNVSSQEFIAEALTNVGVASTLAMIPNRNNSKRAGSNIWQRLINNIIKSIKSILGVKNIRLKDTTLESILYELNAHAPIVIKAAKSNITFQDTNTQEIVNKNNEVIEKDTSNVNSPVEEQIQQKLDNVPESETNDISDIEDGGLLFSTIDDMFSFDNLTNNLTESEKETLYNSLKSEKIVVTCKQ